MGMVEIAGAIISRAQQRVEVSAQNIANMTTAGYKARRQFSDMISDAPVDPSATSSGRDDWFIDFSPGKPQNTANTFDLAIGGRGFFAVRAGEAIHYTRNGAFDRDADGHLVTPGGAVLQANGGDLMLGTGEVKILGDGTVLQDNQPVDRIVIADFADTRVLQPAGDGLFAAPSGTARDVAAPQIRQGMLESSNVSTADEMRSSMAALRSAEAGQRVVQVYDDLMGRAITAFGQG